MWYQRGMAIDDRTAPSTLRRHPRRRTGVDRVPAEISRSWLLVSGTATDRFEKSQRSRADQIILDIEDAVDPAAKPTAAGASPRGWPAAARPGCGSTT